MHHAYHVHYEVCFPTTATLQPVVNQDVESEATSKLRILCSKDPAHFWLLLNFSSNIGTCVLFLAY